MSRFVSQMWTLSGRSPLAWAVLAAAIVYFWVVSNPPAETYKGMDLAEFGRIPAVSGGRIMPMDTVARNSLMLISGRTSFYDDKDNYVSATRWLLDVMTRQFFGNDAADKAKVFRVENENVLSLLNLHSRPGYRYSIEEMKPRLNEALLAAKAAKEKLDSEQKLDVDEEKVLELHQKLRTFMHLANYDSPFVVPADKPQDWQPLMHALREAHNNDVEHELAKEYTEILAAYAGNDASKFNSSVAKYQLELKFDIPEDAKRTSFERYFNNAAPFYHCLIMYLVVFLLAAFSWTGWSQPLSRAAFALLILTVVIHTFALFGRMYLLERPYVFVTNLYSSAVFIGWACVLLGIVLELFLGRGMGTAVAAKTGFLSLVVAQLLAVTGGDTFAVMQAVLDTNFWLATHVTCITLGYAATFFAGFLGIIYVFMGVFGHNIDRDVFPRISRAIYGVVCFATMFSFVGTVLGGIWADQSWGRFWGWDPKENGALIIVLWNALILHARWGGVFKHRGVAVAAIAGNIVTTWSWFGVNLLGVGLHTYGFSKETFIMLVSFVLFNLAVIALGMTPRRFWLSSMDRPAERRGLSVDWS